MYKAVQIVVSRVINTIGGVEGKHQKRTTILQFVKTIYEHPGELYRFRFLQIMALGPGLCHNRNSKFYIG